MKRWSKGDDFDVDVVDERTGVDVGPKEEELGADGSEVGVGVALTVVLASDSDVTDVEDP